MPWAPAKHCAAGHPPYQGRRCPVCASIRRAAADARRPTAPKRGYDSKWRRESKAFLARPENRFCVCGCGKPAEMVDHRIAHKGDMRLFWDRSNWQPMTRACNSRKAVREEGGFGNRIASPDRPFTSATSNLNGSTFTKRGPNLNRGGGGSEF